MSARLLDGRAVARAILDDLRTRVQVMVHSGEPVPTLAVVRVGNQPASVRYAAQIERSCRAVGFGCQIEALPDQIDDAELKRALDALGADDVVNGILLQLPLPPHLSRERAEEAIAPIKDVDGINPINAGHLYLGRGRFFAPATALGGLELLRRAGLPIGGRHAVVVGRSEVVGRPLAMLLLRENATVTICHSQTLDLARYTRQADILAVAVGRPQLITGAMVAPGVVVLDFGTNVVDGRVVGDVDFDSVAPVASAITPVPGGTGPMTTATLLLNTLEAAHWQRTGAR